MWKGALILTLCGLSVVECGVSLAGVTCGVKSCKLNEYCSEFDRTCLHCSTICNDSSHNYDRGLCEKECQGFIHDNLYVRKDSVGGTGNEDLRGIVERLSRIVIGTLIIVCLMLIVLFCFLCFQFYRWKDKKNLTFASLKNKILGKKPSTMSPEENPAAMTNNLGKNEKVNLRLEMPSINTQGSDHSPVTVTTSISRRPAEDSTLEYAYDNPAMSPSR